MRLRTQALLVFAVVFLEKTHVACALPEIVIAEVDYDQPGSDTAEWVEIHSLLDVEISLDGYNLAFYDAAINGTCAEYCRIDLSPLWINSNESIVVGNHPCALLPLCSATDAIQNGSPDAITIEYFGEIVFAVEYGGSSSISACADIAPFWRTSAVDLDTTLGSLQWCRNGWRFSPTSTPCVSPVPYYLCPATDAPMPPQRVTWGLLKSTYR